MQRTGSKSWAGKNDIVPRTLRFSNHVVKAGIKTTGKGSPGAREPIVNRTRNTLEITEENIVKTTANGSTSTSSKDFVTKNKKRKRQNIVHFGAKDQESEKLETSLVPSVTLCGTPTVKTCNQFSLCFSYCYYSKNKLCIRLFVLFITI